MYQRFQTSLHTRYKIEPQVDYIAQVIFNKRLNVRDHNLDQESYRVSFRSKGQAFLFSPKEKQIEHILEHVIQIRF